MTKDIKAIAIAYTFIVLIFWIVTLNYTHSKEVAKLNVEIAELNKTVKELKEYVDVLEQSREQLNNALEDRELYIINLEKNNTLLKELSLVDGDIKYLTVAVCKTESDLNKKAKHKRKSIIGYLCGIDKLWLDEIPELNRGNINTLYGGSLVIKHLMTKYKSKREVIKRYKGIESKSNMYLVDRVIKIEKGLK